MLLEFSFPQALVLAAVALTVLAVADAVLGRIDRTLARIGRGDPLDALDHLDLLRRAGTITDGEFEARKRDLLERI
jgi:Short C-terminal domain